MRRLVEWIAEPLALAAIALAVVWAAHHMLTPVRVAGWSMSPTLVPGDIVLVRVGARPIVGDIVLLEAPGHQPVLHRVTRVLDSGSVTTKGDANQVADLEPSSSGAIAGRAVAIVPVGRWLARWRGRQPSATMASQSNSAKR
jgi:signal peptidase I